MDNVLLCLVCRGLLLGDELFIVSGIGGGGGEENRGSIGESSICITELPFPSLLVVGGDGERRLVPLIVVDVVVSDRLASNRGLLLLMIGDINPEESPNAGGEGERLFPMYHIPLDGSSSIGSSIDNNAGGVEYVLLWTLRFLAPMFVDSSSSSPLYFLATASTHFSVFTVSINVGNSSCSPKNCSICAFFWASLSFMLERNSISRSSKSSR